VPVVGAPLAGGPSTPALAAAVSEAGGIGFLAAGYKTAAATQAELQELRALTSRPIGLNLFCPTRDVVDDVALAAYADRMRGEAQRYGVAAGEPRWTDDDWTAKLDVTARERPDVVSFTFGCPEREIVEWLQGCGCRVWCTVTSVTEAELATSRKVDALVVQGAEAGGHQGSFENHDQEPRPLLALLGEIEAATALPRIAAGGIAEGCDIAAVLAAGAVAAQIGSALLLATEAGTSPPYRAALEQDAETRLTRAFTGRRARGIVNRFLIDNDPFAPMGYPEIHYLTAPIRAAARELGDADGINLWAGTSYRRAREASASELVERWAREMSARY
jgi:nitronate monooxygenase